MSWFAGASAFEHRRKRLEERHAALTAAGAPPTLHPALGLGGRSIELSVAQGLRVDDGAFELAVDELHQHVTAGDHDVEELRAAARWLDDFASGREMSAAARDRLSADLAALNA